jgi:hypothetical protein
VPYPNTQNEIKHFLRRHGMKLYVLYTENIEIYVFDGENGELAMFYSIDTIDTINTIHIIEIISMLRICGIKSNMYHCTENIWKYTLDMRSVQKLK